MTTLTALGGLNLLRSDGVHFDVEVSVLDGALAPLVIGESETGAASLQPGARFAITIAKAYAGGDYGLDNVTIRVFVDDERVHEEHHDRGPLTQLGTHEWTWDGFTDQGKYSTWDLVGTRIQVMVVARHYPLATGDIGYVDVRANRGRWRRWLWVEIDKAKKQADVWIRFGLQFMDDHARRGKSRYASLFVGGVEKYWSRNHADGPEIDGERYAVRVHAEALTQADENTLDFEIYWTNDPEYVRSHNTGIIDGHVFYNAGAFATQPDADARFEYTSAHEFGHTVLQLAGSTHFSWTHKGSTTLRQATHAQTPHYPPAPIEIEMMLYFLKPDPPASDFYARVHASNADVMRLVSIGDLELT